MTATSAWADWLEPVVIEPDMFDPEPDYSPSSYRWSRLDTLPEIRGSWVYCIHDWAAANKRPVEHFADGPGVGITLTRSELLQLLDALCEPDKLRPFLASLDCIDPIEVRSYRVRAQEF
jgi:hypothetical protein